MTKEQCQNINIVGIEYRDDGSKELTKEQRKKVYDGVYDWYCTHTKQTVCRWKLRPDGYKTNEEDESAFDKLCDGCEVPSQD